MKALAEEELEKAMALVLDGKDVLASQDINVGDFFCDFPNGCKEYV